MREMIELHEALFKVNEAFSLIARSVHYPKYKEFSRLFIELRAEIEREIDNETAS